MMNRRDFVFFIDRKWVPSNDGSLLRKVFNAICDGKTVEGALECLKKEETEQPATVYTVESLKEMGFHYPELALRVIDFIDHSTSLDGIKDLKVENGETGERSCVNSYYVETTRVYKWKVLYVYLTAPDFPFSFADTGKGVEDYVADCLCFLNSNLIPTANENDQFGVIWDTDIENVPLEKALEIHLKKDKSPTNPKEEAPKKYPWTKYPGLLPEDMIVGFDEGEEVVPKSKDETAPQPNSDDSDLRNAIKFCEAIFEMKMRIYGYSFCYMHPETVTDQLFMKATILKKRLTDRDKGKRFELAFFEGMRDEFAAVVNYGIIALRQGGFCVQTLEVPESPMRFYSDQMQAAFELISKKGTEYGELWRKQRIGTFADMIEVKIRRLKSIEDRYRIGGLTEEDYHKFAGDQYRDLINYGLFGVVRMTEIADVMAFEMKEDETDEEE